MFWIFHQVYLGNNIPKSHIHYYSHQYHQPVKEKCIVTMATPSDIWDEFHLTLCLIFQVCSVLKNITKNPHCKPISQMHGGNSNLLSLSIGSLTFLYLSFSPLSSISLSPSLSFHLPFSYLGGVLKFGLGRGVHAGDSLDIGSRPILYQRPRFGAKQLMKLNQ